MVGLHNFPKVPKIATVSCFEVDDLQVKIIILNSCNSSLEMNIYYSDYLKSLQAELQQGSPDSSVSRASDF